jgi:SAM-dependent methyltransferase
MGINAEFVEIARDLCRSGLLSGDTVVEIGAQDVCAAPGVLNTILGGNNFPSEGPQPSAAELYKALGFPSYTAIDATGAGGALLYDLNRDLNLDYQFTTQFDLVTNLGTAEHCFNQFSVFKNLHDLCRVGGIIIHALPAQGNVNHGFYNYHPRFFADVAAANGYTIERLSYTIDYARTLHEYSIESYKKHDAHDVLFYCVFIKKSDEQFRTPFDGMFASSNQLGNYIDAGADPLKTMFAPYLKGDFWVNTRGLTEQTLASPINHIKDIPARALLGELLLRTKRRLRVFG